MTKEKLQDFKENNFQILLKYDGERPKNIYSVILIPMNDRNNMRSWDTDSCLETLSELISTTKVDIGVQTCKFTVEIFEKFTDLLLKKLGDDIIFFIFGISNTNGIEYYTSISSKDTYKHLADDSLENIIQYLDLSEQWEYC